MKSYCFDMGDSRSGPVGFVARVKAETPEEAAKMLNEALGDCVEVRTSNESIEYINIYFNEHAVTAADAEDEQEE